MCQFREIYCPQSPWSHLAFEAVPSHFAAKLGPKDAHRQGILLGEVSRRQMKRLPPTKSLLKVHGEDGD